MNNLVRGGRALRLGLNNHEFPLRKRPRIGIERAATILCAVGLAAIAAGCGGGSIAQPPPPPPPPPPSIFTASLSTGMLTFPYSQTVETLGGTLPFTWSISSGMLPQNLSFTNAAGSGVTISGMPTQVESQTFTVQVKDALGQSGTKSYTIMIKDLAAVQLQQVPGQVPAGTIEIQGVGAGPFNPSAWQQGTLHWVPDVRVPIFAALPTGQFQNVYFPWPLEQPGGWRMFYGGWDGTVNPNDQVYSATTSDFLTFNNRTLVIAHGAFEHVNNMNVQQLPDGSMHMICTALTNSHGLDKPAYFSSPDGVIWNGSPEPYSAEIRDIVTVLGDPLYGGSDYNGGNVLLRDNGSWTLYYSIGAFGRGANKVYRATATSPPAFNAGGIALDSGDYASDVKKFQVQGQNWYLMALYYEAISVGEPPGVFTYALSTDGVSFRAGGGVLFGGVSAADKFPTTPAFVTQNGHILGVLYGGDRYDFLDGRDQIFARWLQKSVVIQDSSGTVYAPQGGFGPDRQWFTAPPSGTLQGTITVFAEDGITPLGTAPITLNAGQSYQLSIP